MAHASVRLAVGTSLILAGVLIAAVGVRPVKADYTPPPLPSYWTTVGSGGALLQDQGVGLSMADAVYVWNTWTSKSKLAGGTSGCGTTTACVIFAWENADLTWTYCTVPPTGAHATANLIGVTMNEGDCLDLDDGYRIFVVSVNYVPGGYTSPLSLHIQRHETGHAIGLWDAPTATCWSDGGYWMPLMNNGTLASSYCPAYPNNYTATYNEALYAVLRSGW